MHLLRLALVGALLLPPALAAADEPPPIPYARAPMQQWPAPYTPKLRYKRHSLPLMAGGITLTAIGVLSILGGITAFIEDQNSGGDARGYLGILVGIPLLIHGAGCIGGGIPMWRIGDRTIPAGWAAIPSISVGKTSTLRWSF